ncbi:unnamed protein product [Amaranthus hypochondriacus]
MARTREEVIDVDILSHAIGKPLGNVNATYITSYPQFLNNPLFEPQDSHDNPLFEPQRANFNPISLPQATHPSQKS